MDKNINKSLAISNFLKASTHPDLAELYSLKMECQVNVAQDNGERCEGEFKGHKWNGWTDGLTTWKSFRIPYKAATEPEYTDHPINFDLAQHTEGIGLTGWDWENKLSLWVAFDFDAITGHSDKHNKKLTEDQLIQIYNEALKIPWITIRKSTSGKGLHFYIFLKPTPTQNHNEHAALARAILGQITALTGFNFQNSVDICGGNMWIWHRKMKDTEGLLLLRKGTILEDIPQNWKDHITVIKNKRKRNLPQDINSSFESLVNQRSRTPLDDEHKKLLTHLSDTKALWWWDQDLHMLVTHTSHLKDAHKELNLKGFFDTLATGKDKFNDWNCFGFPLPNGTWSIRRYSQGVKEHDSWTQDGKGWTKCYLNRFPDLMTACRAVGALEDPKGGFVFDNGETAIKAAKFLNVDLDIPPFIYNRQIKFKQNKDGRLIVFIQRTQLDNMPGWLEQRGWWTKIYQACISNEPEVEINNYDNVIRHIVTEESECGWMVKADNKWRSEPKHQVKDSLIFLGLSSSEATHTLGSAVHRPWILVNRPFQPEYPGNREWNKNAAKLRYNPNFEKEQLLYPTWLKVLNHCGSGLNEAIKNDSWCQENGILTGGDYLKCWVSSLFKYPLEPLPYLFFFGPQNSGKSVFHEALELLVVNGYEKANIALTSKEGFNGELEGKVICAVDELDIRNNKIAYNRIKEWVTARHLLIHPKGETPFTILNSTHWIHTANPFEACPIFPDDTRITMCYVQLPNEIIPKRDLLAQLEYEAADFLAEILKMELPRCKDRLNIPVITTTDKLTLEDINQTPLEKFLRDSCIVKPGYGTTFNNFYQEFLNSLEPDEQMKWTKIGTGKKLHPPYLKGRSTRHNGEMFLLNLIIKDKEAESIYFSDKPLILRADGFIKIQD